MKIRPVGAELFHTDGRTDRYRGADKSLARCILFDGENISLDASLVIYINSTNVPPIKIINRIHEHQNFVTVACFFPGRANDLSAPLYDKTNSRFS
jgi:adenosine/AMP kinase